MMTRPTRSADLAASRTVPDMSPAALLERIRSGDRDAAAEMIERYKPLIRQRCRSRIKPRLRSVTDSEDLWSTVARRFDVMMIRGGLVLDSERAFWVLLGTLIDHAVVDRARVLKRLERVASEDEPFAVAMRTRLEHDTSTAGSELLLEAMNQLPRQSDRDILTLWLFDHSHRQIADALGSTESAVRMRWHEIRGILRQSLDGSMR